MLYHMLYQAGINCGYAPTTWRAEQGPCELMSVWESQSETYWVIVSQNVREWARERAGLTRNVNILFVAEMSFSRCDPTKSENFAWRVDPAVYPALCCIRPHIILEYRSEQNEHFDDMLFWFSTHPCLLNYYLPSTSYKLLCPALPNDLQTS